MLSKDETSQLVNLESENQHIYKLLYIQCTKNQNAIYFLPWLLSCKTFKPEKENKSNWVDDEVICYHQRRKGHRFKMHM